MCSFPGPCGQFTKLDLLCPEPAAPLFGLTLCLAPSPFMAQGTSSIKASLFFDSS